MILFFLLLMLLFRSVCHQVSNQADKLDLLAIFIISRSFSHLFNVSPTRYRTSLGLPSFFNRLCACKFANSHHASFTLYLFSILSHIFTLFNHLCEFLCTFYAIYCVVIHHHLPAVFILHFYDFSVACCQPFL